MRDYFEVMFLLSKVYNWSIAEQEDMVPWERNIYSKIAQKDMQDEVKRKELAAKASGANGYQVIMP